MKETVSFDACNAQFLRNQLWIGMRQIHSPWPISWELLYKISAKFMCSQLSSDQNPCYFPWNESFNRDPFNVLWFNPHIPGQYHPRNTPNNHGSFHCSPPNFCNQWPVAVQELIQLYNPYRLKTLCATDRNFFYSLFRFNVNFQGCTFSCDIDVTI